MIDVRKVFITKEVAENLEINPSYLIRLAKTMVDEGKITNSDMRMAGKRNYIFNEKAIEEIRKKLKK